MRDAQLRVRVKSRLQLARQLRDPRLLRLPTREEFLAGQASQIGHAGSQTGPRSSASTDTRHAHTPRRTARIHHEPRMS
jgi:hypothetical protein